MPHVVLVPGPDQVEYCIWQGWNLSQWPRKPAPVRSTQYQPPLGNLVFRFNSPTFCTLTFASGLKPWNFTFTRSLMAVHIFTQTATYMYIHIYNYTSCAPHKMFSVTYIWKHASCIKLAVSGNSYSYLLLAYLHSYPAQQKRGKMLSVHLALV